ncbi:MAG: hypothetical protein ACMG57_01600 [Candidatus Dojkabacteria bacterium]
MIIDYPGDLIPGKGNFETISAENEEVDLKTRVIAFVNRDPNKLEELKAHLQEILRYYLSQSLSPFAKVSFEITAQQWIKPNEEYQSWEEAEEFMFALARGIEYVTSITQVFETAFKTLTPIHPTTLDHMSMVFALENGAMLEEALWILSTLEDSGEMHAYQLRLIEIINNIKTDKEGTEELISDHSRQIEVFLTLLSSSKRKNDLKSLKVILETFYGYDSIVQEFCFEYKGLVNVLELWLEILYNESLEGDEDSYNLLVDSFLDIVMIYNPADEQDLGKILGLIEKLENHSPFGKVIQLFLIFSKFKVEQDKRLQNLAEISDAVSKADPKDRNCFILPIFAFWTILEPNEIEFILNLLVKDSKNTKLVEELKLLNNQYNSESD